MLLVVARLPPSMEAALPEAARVTGLALAEVRMRLAGTLPRVLLSEVDHRRIAAAVGALEALGFGAFACDPIAAPQDDDRIVARGLEMTARGLVVTDARAERHEVPAGGIAFILRGTRLATTATTAKTSERHLSLGRAVLTGGLLWTKRVDRTTTKTTEEREEMLLLHRRDGLLQKDEGNEERDLVLYERRLDYRFLGAAAQPSSRANFETMLARLRALAPQARFDDRIGRAGFLTGLPATSADPLDLALFLVTIALTTSVPITP